MADVTVARAAQGSVAAAISQARGGVFAWAAAGVAMVLVLLAPALWNGFPFIFPDTGGYILRPIEGTLEMGRSALYGLFLYPGAPFAFWPTVAAQAAIIAWLIVLTLRLHGLGQRPLLALTLVAGLSVATSLPWFAGQLMPDIFFPAAILALFVLSFHSERVSKWERLALTAIIAMAMASHMAAAGMCVAVVIGLWLPTRLSRFGLPKLRMTFAGTAVAAGIALCPVSNYAITGNFAFTPGGTSFLFGRVLEDGIVARYLDDTCPTPSQRLCAYKDRLPEDADDWLWDYDGPFYVLGGWIGFAAEERAIILATLKRFPLMHAEAAVAVTFDQFISFQTEISLEDNEPTTETFADELPGLYPRLMQARQQAEKLDVSSLNFLHVPVAALSIAGLAAALVLRRCMKIAPEFAALAFVVLLALAANAAVCGIFSHSVDRYQSRLVPLAPLAMALLIAGRISNRPGRATPS